MYAEWFLTVSPSSIDSVDEKIVTQLLSTKCVAYHWVEEHGKTGSHTHWHGFCRFEKPIRSDSVRRMFKSMFLEEDQCTKISFLVKKVEDYKGLIRYLSKEKGRVLDTTLTPEEVEQICLESPRSLSNMLDGNKRKQITIIGAADKIIKFAQEHYSSNQYQLHDRSGFQEVIFEMMDHGYRFETIWGRLKGIWVQCNGLIGNRRGVDIWSDDK